MNMTYNAPPGMGAPKKGANPLIWIFVALGAFCCIGIIAFGGMSMAVLNQTKNLMPCMFSMATLNKSMEDYVKEKGTYPPAATWQDELAPYYEKQSKSFTEEFKNAPGPVKDWGDIADINAELGCNTSGTPKTSLAFNPDLAGKKPTDIKDSDTIMFFETTSTGRNISEKPVERKFKDAPKMMGSPRGWYQMNTEGRMVVVDENGKIKHVDINTR
jgi:hypothetical protein